MLLRFSLYNIKTLRRITSTRPLHDLYTRPLHDLYIRTAIMYAFYVLILVCGTAVRTTSGKLLVCYKWQYSGQGVYSIVTKAVRTNANPGHDDSNFVTCKKNQICYVSTYIVVKYIHIHIYTHTYIYIYIYIYIYFVIHYSILRYLLN